MNREPLRLKIARRLLGSKPGVRLSPKGHRYDWHPDKPDFRDMPYRASRRFMAEPVPTAADLRLQMPPVVDQGTIGSCTANALSGALEYLQAQQLKVPGKQPQEYDPERFWPVSRLFIYWNERDIAGVPYEDAGGYLRDGIRALWRIGACREEVWPYERRLLFRTPSTDALAEAGQYKITEYQRCISIQQVKQAIAEGFPVAFGFQVYDSFESDEVERSGFMPMPAATENDLGGHAVLAVGYDDSKQYMVVRNSWGTGWGDKGYFYMPYAYISNPNLAEDFWVVRG